MFYGHFACFIVYYGTDWLVRYELEAKMVVRRKLVKGDTIKVVVQHVEPFYGRLVLKEYRDDFGIIE